MQLGQVIRTLRESNKITQRLFSKRVGITQAQLSYIESGKSYPSLITIEKICKELSLPIFLLYTLATDEALDTLIDQRLYRRMCLYVKSEFNRIHETDF